MVRCRFWVTCVGVVLLTAPRLQELRAEDQSVGRHAVESSVADANLPSEDVIFEEQVNSGFVFLDFQYLAPPYLVLATADSVTVNGRSWPMPAQRGRTPENGFDSGEHMARPQRWGGGWRGNAGGFVGGARSGGGNGGFHPTRWTARQLVEDLEINSVVMATSGGEPEVVSSLADQHDLFLALLRHDSGIDETEAISSLTASDSDLERWNEWTSGVTVTADLQTRAVQLINEVGATQAMNTAAIRAQQRLSTLAYPLTVLGMVLGVLALGHLLKSFSRIDGMQDNLLPPEVLRATSVSIGLMVALSLFDLTWTILASQAGQMRELNPLGSRLISDPMMLIVFKFMATLVGCGLLFALRRHERARQACWWLCLVCTVLTFRWVMFNSMFVA